MVLGETEILGQVKDAYATAFGARHTAGRLNHLFQQAFRVAKRVRTETALGRGAVSVGAAAARLAASALGDLSSCRTLLRGPGPSRRPSAANPSRSPVGGTTWRRQTLS